VTSRSRTVAYRREQPQRGRPLAQPGEGTHQVGVQAIVVGLVPDQPPQLTGGLLVPAQGERDWACDSATASRCRVAATAREWPGQPR
jgi:hypothetical protein